MTTYYIATPTNESHKQFFNEHYFPYLAPEYSTQPEGYLVQEGLINTLPEGMDLYKIPERVMKKFDDVQEFVEAYWDGDVYI